MHDFPTVTQYASEDLIEAMAYQGHPVADDPRWPESGAPTLAEYTRWAGNICGIACLRMALLRRDGSAPRLFDLLDGARKYGAYEELDGGAIRGLIYAPFVDYVRAEHGFEAEVQGRLPVEDLLTLVRNGFTVIASVNKQIRRPELPAPGKGGHLVYVTGHRDGQLHFRNPSGHTDQTRKAAIPVDVFTEFYAERGVSFA